MGICDEVIENLLGAGAPLGKMVDVSHDDDGQITISHVAPITCGSAEDVIQLLMKAVDKLSSGAHPCTLL